jgi:hypothetical protein
MLIDLDTAGSPCRQARDDRLEIGDSRRSQSTRGGG